MALEEFPDAVLQQVGVALADATTHGGLDELFSRLGILAAGREAGSKWRRIHIGLAARQREDRCGNSVGAFIQAIMDPVRHVGGPERFGSIRVALNRVLAFVGLTLGEDGVLARATTAKTLTEADRRADALRAELGRRSVHPDVLRFCRPELLQQDYFHAVLEATKSVAEKIRVRTGLTDDGAPLVQAALGGDRPLLAINTLVTETEQGEQRGLVHLLVGMFGTFRNPTAHAPRLSWPMTEADALDLLTLVSFFHRRLDAAVRTPYTRP